MDQESCCLKSLRAAPASVRRVAFQPHNYTRERFLRLLDDSGITSFNNGVHDKALRLFHGFVGGAFLNPLVFI